MPRKLEYREVVKRVRAQRKQVEVKTRRGKGSHVMLFDPECSAHYPLPHHGNDKRVIPSGMLKDLIRVFDLPEDIFD